MSGVGRHKMRVRRTGFRPAKGIPVMQHKAVEGGFGRSGVLSSQERLRGVHSY